MLWFSDLRFFRWFKYFSGAWDLRRDSARLLLPGILFKSVSDLEQPSPASPTETERCVWEPGQGKIKFKKSYRKVDIKNYLSIYWPTVTVTGGSMEDFLRAAFFLKGRGWLEIWLRESKEQKRLLFPASLRQDRRRLEFILDLTFSCNKKIFWMSVVQYCIKDIWVF